MLFELKTIRKKSGLSQEEAAEQFGVPLNTYRNWEQLKTMPRNRADIPRLAAFFGVTVEDLFGNDLVEPGAFNAIYENEQPPKVVDKRLQSIELAYASMNENGRHVLASVATSLAKDPANAGGE